MKGGGAVAAQSLREQLLALPGVAEAEVDGGDAAPAGVRIRLATDADAAAVGAEVQRVLAARGVRSRLGREEPPAAPAAPSVPDRAEDAPIAKPGAARALEWVSVEERAGALQVTVVDSGGRRVVRSATVVDEPGLVAAVIAAVGMLLEGAEPGVLSVEWATVADTRVVTVVLQGAGGRRG
ncbi:MAG: hypothetical protein H6R33_691, partial [Actinobacteria bacterium]|nr:hypothetical protein [Actinomycetota bacterium]